MLTSRSILQLYENAMYSDMHRYDVPEDAVRIGIESMAIVYQKDVVSLNSERSLVADYNDVAHRCAYLHKYAAFHTAMVRDLFLEALQMDYNFFRRWLFTEHNFKICSLGGGPGSDVLGALSALETVFSYFDATATIVDYMFNWSYSFNTILNELSSGMYGSFGQFTSYNLKWRYLQANLLKALSPEVVEALSDASLVTMIKFASAAACADTEAMMKKIFIAMKPGAMVLFIDNDGGGFHQIFMDSALKFNFISIFGPYRHRNYINDMMRVKKFGYYSCCKTTVTVHILQKPYFYGPACLSPSPYNANRRVFLESPSLLVSPPTPMLLDPYCDFTGDESINCRDFRSPLVPLSQSPADISFPSPASIPLPPGTPPVHFRDMNFENHPLPPRTPQGYFRDAGFGNHPLPPRTPQGYFRDMSFENHPPMSPAVRTPIGNGRRRRLQKSNMGCFPIRNFRHHLAAKVNIMKSRAASLFKRKKKNKKAAHPIFKL